MINNSFTPILLTIAISIALIFLYSIFKALAPAFFLNLKEKKRYLKLLYYSEIVGGILTISLFIGYLSKRSTITALVLLVLLLISLVFIGWFFMKDYIAGLIVKASNNYCINDVIVVNHIEGRIIKFGQRSIVVASTEGNKVFVPYSSLVGQIKSIKSTSEIKNNYNFNIKISAEKDIDKTIIDIKKYIITLPWVNNSNVAHVKIEKEEEEFNILNISLISFDMSYNLKIESAVLDWVSRIC
jgi:small-conductance mechanosensitive channel